MPLPDVLAFLDAQGADETDVMDAVAFVVDPKAAVKSWMGWEQTSPDVRERRNQDGTMTRTSSAGNLSQLQAIGGVSLPDATVDAVAGDAVSATADWMRWVKEPVDYGE